jgi:nucleoporin NDC1
MARCVWSSILLSFIWLAGNTAFSIFLVKEPIKNGRPLSSDSKDPNGSLLNGLKSKKLPIKVNSLSSSL